jgi:hypothetical protein
VISNKAEAVQSAPPRAAPERTVAAKASALKRSLAAKQPSETAPEPVQQAQRAPSAPSTMDVAVAASPAATPAAAPAFTTPVESTAGSLAPAHGFPILPWLLAAVALGAGGAFLFWRNRSQAALAGVPQLAPFSAEPAPAPSSAPSPPPPPPPAGDPAPAPRPSGIVSTGLRPWVEVAMQPLRCIVTDEAVTVEFELDLFNSGSGPARDIHVAAALINAGESQDEALANFFAQRPGPGERIPVILPLKRVTFATQIVTARSQVQVLEMGGRQVFVPILAFNANYGSAGKEGQTSVSYLVGRDGNGEKLAPFRLDLGPRLFRNVATRPLPIGIRR